MLAEVEMGSFVQHVRKIVAIVLGANQPAGETQQVSLALAASLTRLCGVVTTCGASPNVLVQTPSPPSAA